MDITAPKDAYDQESFDKRTAKFALARSICAKLSEEELDFIGGTEHLAAMVDKVPLKPLTPSA